MSNFNSMTYCKMEDTYKKLYKFINDINDLIDPNDKIELCLKLFNFLTTDEECIKILKSSNKFCDICIQKFESELSCNINNDTYNKIYNKLIKINTDKNRIKYFETNFSNDGQKIETVNI